MTFATRVTRTDKIKIKHAGAIVFIMLKLFFYEILYNVV